MAMKQLGKGWTRADTLKSTLWFILHFIIFVGIAAGLLLGNKLSILGEFMRAQGANYLYAIFCVFLLITIMYFYFFFEDREMIGSGKNIALIFEKPSTRTRCAFNFKLLNRLQNRNLRPSRRARGVAGIRVSRQKKRNLYEHH